MPRRRKRRTRSDGPPHPDQSLRWRAWPAARNPRLAVAVGALVVIVAIVVGLAFRGVFWVAVAVLFLGGSLIPFFGPTWYELTEDGVTVRGVLYRTSKEWTAFRACRSDDESVLLSPFSRPSRLDAFRGVVLRFDGNKDEVMAFVQRKLPHPKTKDAA